MPHDETQVFEPDKRTTHETDSRETRLDEAIAAYLRAAEEGGTPDQQAWLNHYPDVADELAEFFADRERVEQIAGPMRHVTGEPEPGSRVKYVGDYELLDELGRGGMGVVYRAQQLSLKRQVALKMILAGDHASPEDLARFRAEAEAAASLQHPHIVQIYEIGEHEGRPYAALEYVPAGSLERKLTGAPLPVRQAARLVELLARAMHAAHERGIVHRDLKPANILLAASQGSQGVELSGTSEEAATYEPKVTDFGLAKLLQEERGQTRSGAILGTPSYMAPEQAAAKREIGPAADIYSLGAILYELLTGRPPFRAETPLETIRQVLENEPAAPRLLNAGTPRDLETICLKCLGKDPYNRYESAAELADDLERFLEGEPIRARPVGPVEKLGRWVWKRRRAAALVAGTAAAVVAIVVGAMRGMETYREAQLADVRFHTDGPALTAELLHPDRDELVAPRFTVPTQEPQRLPAGEFRLRLSAPRQVSEEYQFLVERGVNRTWQVGLTDRALWDGVEIGPNEQYTLIDLTGAPDILVYHKDGMRRIRGSTGEVAWEQTRNLPEGNDGFTWAHLSPHYPNDSPLHILRHAPDLNDDGVGDVVVGSSKRPVMMALSGATGEFLWTWSVEPAPRHVTGTVAALETYDVNDDGVKDVLGVVQASGSAPAHEGGIFLGQHAVAISGSDGELLWERRINAPSFDRLDAAPMVSELAETSEGPLFVFRLFKMWRFNALTGEQLGEEVLFPDAVTLADLDGDGQADAALREEFTQDAHNVEAISLEAGESRLRTAFPSGLFPVASPSFARRASWPSLVDLNEDGAAEFLQPYRKYDRYGERQSLQVFDVRTGDLLWERLLPMQEIQTVEEHANLRLTAGPDLNGDGWRELFLATLGMESSRSPVTHHVFVDALSGKDGELLSTWRRQAPGYAWDVSLGELKWGWRGRDGWPVLAVPHRYPYSSIFPSQTYLVDIGIGRLHEVLQNVSEVHPADFDGDGVTDLYWYEPLEQHNSTWGGELRCVRGRLPAWRRLEQWQAGPDFNGDGVADLFNAGGGAPTSLAAVSGADGATQWLSDVQGESYRAQPAPQGDFNGDDVADVAVMRQANRWAPSPLSMVSGRDGSLLWTVPQPRASGDRSVRPGALFGVQDLDGDGECEVVAAFLIDSSRGDPSADTAELAAYAGRSGDVLWRRPLDIKDWKEIQPSYVDLTSDGTKDLILPFESADATILAVDGQSGERLWKWAAPGERFRSDHLSEKSPSVLAVADFLADGEPGVIVNASKLYVLNASGEEAWTWEHQRQVEKDGGSSTAHGQIKTAIVRRASPRRFGVYAFDSVRIGRGDRPQTRIIECSAQGEMVQEALLSDDASLSCHDVDGDGEDETLILTETELQVFDDRLDAQPRWTWPRPEGRAHLLGLRQSPGAENPEVMIAVEQSVYGVASGELRWRVEVAEPLTGRLRNRYRLQTPTMLPASGDALPSFFVSHWPGGVQPGQGVACRQAALTSPDGRYLPPRGQPRPYEDPISDPRQLRPLPWSGFAEAVPWLTALSLAIAGAANLLAFRWGRRPPLSGVMLVLMTVAALGLAGLISPLAIPVSIFFFLLIRYGVQRRWTAAAVVLLGAFAVTAVVLGVVAWQESQVLLPGQRLQWQGWHAAFYFGAYATGLLAVPVIVVVSLVRREAEVRRRRQRLRKQMQIFETPQHPQDVGS